MAELEWGARPALVHAPHVGEELLKGRACAAEAPLDCEGAHGRTRRSRAHGSPRGQTPRNTQRHFCGRCRASRAPAFAREADEGHDRYLARARSAPTAATKVALPPASRRAAEPVQAFSCPVRPSPTCDHPAAQRRCVVRASRLQAPRPGPRSWWHRVEA